MYRPNGQPCSETKEFGLVKNMLIAAVEERYKDAGKNFNNSLILTSNLCLLCQERFRLYVVICNLIAVRLVA